MVELLPSTGEILDSVLSIAKIIFFKERKEKQTERRNPFK